MSVPTDTFSAVQERLKPAKKIAYFAKLTKLASECEHVIIADIDNVGSRQMAEVRAALRGKATLLMGKKSMMRTCLNKMVTEKPELCNLVPILKNNIGLIFCEDEISEVRTIMAKYQVPAPAKQGSIAPCSVIIPAGPTGMDPGQTSFFQALQIATRIVKGQIEIQSDVAIITGGEKVSASQSVLLNKLNIKPFSYGLKTTLIYEAGSIYPASVLDIEPESLVDALKSSIQACAALSLAAGVPCKASIGHSLINAIRKTVCLALASDHIFPQMAKLKEMLDNPDAYASLAPAAAATPTATETKPVEEEEEEEDDDMGFGLFD